MAFFPGLPAILYPRGPLWWGQTDTGVGHRGPGVGTVAVAPSAISCLSDSGQGAFLPCALVVKSLKQERQPASHRAARKDRSEGACAEAHWKKSPIRHQRAICVLSSVYPELSTSLNIAIPWRLTTFIHLLPPSINIYWPPTLYIDSALGGGEARWHRASQDWVPALETQSCKTNEMCISNHRTWQKANDKQSPRRQSFQL